MISNSNLETVTTHANRVATRNTPEANTSSSEARGDSPEPSKPTAVSPDLGSIPTSSTLQSAPGSEASATLRSEAPAISGLGQGMPQSSMGAGVRALNPRIGNFDPLVLAQLKAQFLGPDRVAQMSAVNQHGQVVPSDQANIAGSISEAARGGGFLLPPPIMG